MATMHRRPLHVLLGGGVVADLLLWRQWNAFAVAVAGATLVWFLFERVGYSVASVLSNALLLLIVILFFSAKSASLLNRPLPPLPNLEVSDVVVEKAASQALVWVNKVLAVAHDIAIKRDMTIFIQPIYIGVLLALLVPLVHERHQDVIDEKELQAYEIRSSKLCNPTQ